MIKENNVVKTDLREEDIDIILGVLCYDGKVEKFSDFRETVTKVSFVIFIFDFLVFSLSCY